MTKCSNDEKSILGFSSPLRLYANTNCTTSDPGLERLQSLVYMTTTTSNTLLKNTTTYFFSRFILKSWCFKNSEQKLHAKTRIIKYWLKT